MKLLLTIFAVLLLSPAAILRAQYETRAEHDPNGIGKFYMGREIAHVMGHQGADWLERPEREVEEKPDLLVQNLGLKAGDHAADLGAGTGYFSWRMAKAVGPTGKVHAIEIQQEMLDRLQKNMRQRGMTNVVSALGTITNINISTNTLDLLLMVDVYHEVSHPQEILRSIHTALKPTGQLVFVEYRKEDPTVPIKEVHKMSEAQVRKEAEANGFKHVKTVSVLPRQHMIFFERAK